MVLLLCCLVVITKQYQGIKKHQWLGFFNPANFGIATISKKFKKM